MGKHAVMQKKEVMRERVVDAARLLFTEHGFHQTAMADLARKADVSVGTIYRAFASKTDIIHAIIVCDTGQMLEDLRMRASQLREGTLSAQDAIERILLERITEGDSALTHEILAEGHRNPDVAATLSQFCCQYGEAIRELILLANPRLSGARLAGAVELLQGCLFGIGHRALYQPDLDDAATARIVAGMVLKNIEDAAG